MQSFIEAGAGKVSLPPSWLRDVITPYSVGLSQDKDIWAHFESYVSKKGFSVRRKMAFNVLMRALKRYELYKGFRPHLHPFAGDANARGIG